MVELGLCSILTSSVTEVVLSYEWWDNSSVTGVSFCTGTDNIIRPGFIMSSCKCPNMFSWSLSMSEADTFCQNQHRFEVINCVAMVNEDVALEAVEIYVQ